MKKKRHIHIVVGALVLLGVGLLILLAVASTQLGLPHPLIAKTLALLSRGCSFSASDSPLGLLPLAGMFFLWGGMCLSFRNRRAFSFVYLPLTALMFYTLLVLSHMLQQSPRPQFLQSLLYSFDADPREASLRVVIAFLMEMALFVVLILIGDGLARRQKKKEAFSLLLNKANSGESVNLGGLSSLQRQKFKRARKRYLKAQKRKKGEKSLGEQPQKPFEAPREEPVSFPPIVEVPTLSSLHQKRERILHKEDAQDVEEEPAVQVGFVSVGALEAIRGERDRNKGVSYLEMKQRELDEKREAELKSQTEGKKAEDEGAKKSPGKLSGFLQGALEAVGKSPSASSAPKFEPTGKARGFLADAVASKEKDQSLEISPPKVKAPARKQEVSPPSIPLQEKKAAAPEPAQEEQGISPFAPQSTARPINGGSSEDAPPPVVLSDEEDLLEVASGVGGLVVPEEGGSALINRKRITYQYPPDTILVTYPQIGNEINEETLERGKILVATLEQFNVHVELTNIVRGPTVTMLEILPAPGVRVNAIVNLADNIAMALAAKQVRIVAPIPGKSAVGIEIPNKKRDVIGFKEMLPAMESRQFSIPMVLGKNLMGEPIVMDVSSSPHLLIAGSTGSGKSVCVNSLICSILFRRSPKEVRLILVDPKIVELSIYNGIPHLLTPVIHDPKKTLKAFDFCLYEMDRRYRLLQGINARNILGYNEKIVQERLAREKLPYIVVVIDEFADLMHTVGKELENKVSRLAAMSRAVGIHLVLATQRPSVDVITGVIKTNIPTRIAFAVTSTTDSRIIIDEGGAEKLLGRGDMLYLASSDPTPERIQGAYLSDREVEEVVQFASKQGVADFIDDSFFEDDEPAASGNGFDSGDGNDDEALLEEALAIVVERKSASASYLQRRLKIGYNRAARLIELMEELGYVGPPNGSKPRELLKMP